MLVDAANFVKKHIAVTRFFPVYLWGFYGLYILNKIISINQKNKCCRKPAALTYKNNIYMKKTTYRSVGLNTKPVSSK